MVKVSDACEVPFMEGISLLVVGVEYASHSWARGIAGEERIGTLPAIAIRGTDRAHFVVVQHHWSVWYVDHEGI